jgi:PAS domain-containing protein
VAQLNTIQNALTEAIQVYSPDGALISRNPAADELFGLAGHQLSRAAMTSKWEFIAEDDTPISEEQGPLAQVMRTGLAMERAVVGMRDRTTATVKWLSLMQQDVQKSSRTTLPRSPAMVRGLSVLNQPAPRSSGARTRAVVARAVINRSYPSPSPELSLESAAQCL